MARVELGNLEDSHLSAWYIIHAVQTNNNDDAYDDHACGQLATLQGLYN